MYDLNSSVRGKAKQLTLEKFHKHAVYTEIAAYDVHDDDKQKSNGAH